MLPELKTDTSEIKQIEIKKFHNGITLDKTDCLIVEAPLEIQLCLDGERPAKSISVTMRTPENDLELAVGFLYTEGIIKNYNCISHVSYPKENIIRLHYKTETDVNLSAAQRNFYTTSSCGVCGKSSIESVIVKSPFEIENQTVSCKMSTLLKLKEALNHNQFLFAQTGGNHAAALFSTNGDLLLLKEDVGRHNAMDKIIGAQLIAQQLPLSNSILLLSGRSSFELIQKAAMAGIAIIASVGAPSSLAYDLAKANNQTLVGFLKSNTCNIYTHDQRIITE